MLKKSCLILEANQNLEGDFIVVKDGNIIVGKYVLNKVNLGDGIVLSLGDNKQKIISLIDEPSRIHRNIRNEVPPIIYNSDIVACYYYDKLKAVLAIDSCDFLDSIIIRNFNISYMGFKIGDYVKLDKSYIDLIQIRSDLIFVKWKHVIDSSIADSRPYKFFDTKLVICFFWKVKIVQENLAQIEEIIIQFPQIIPNNIFKRKKSENKNTLENWCRVIMKDYPK